MTTVIHRGYFWERDRFLVLNEMPSLRVLWVFGPVWEKVCSYEKKCFASLGGQRVRSNFEIILFWIRSTSGEKIARQKKRNCSIPLSTNFFISEYATLPAKFWMLCVHHHQKRKMAIWHLEDPSNMLIHSIDSSELQKWRNHHQEGHLSPITVRKHVLL